MRLLAPVIENPSFNAAVGNIRNVFLPMKPATWPIEEIRPALQQTSSRLDWCRKLLRLQLNAVLQEKAADLIDHSRSLADQARSHPVVLVDQADRRSSLAHSEWMAAGQPPRSRGRL